MGVPGKEEELQLFIKSSQLTRQSLFLLQGQFFHLLFSRDIFKDLLSFVQLSKRLSVMIVLVHNRGQFPLFPDNTLKLSPVCNNLGITEEIPHRVILLHDLIETVKDLFFQYNGHLHHLLKKRNLHEAGFNITLSPSFFTAS